MGGFSTGHWVVVLLIVVLVFGTKKLRSLGKDLGGAVHDFKQGLEESSEVGSSKKEDAVEHQKDNNQSA